jgi:hypothetical protein
MSNPLEKFILENREKFDADTPDPRVWEKICERIDPGETEKAKPIRSLPFKRWLSAAAAVVALGLAGILYLTLHQDKTQSGSTNQTLAKVPPSNHLPIPNTTVDSSTTVVQADPASLEKRYPGDKTQAITDNGENKEMYYYAKLIELKHEELKTLEKDEPLLYRQFSGDVQKLDSVYHSLKTQLPNHSNREQVIEAMISNLQLQIGLLNKQLDIIKQIKHSKKTAYEKAYKSV